MRGYTPANVFLPVAVPLDGTRALNDPVCIRSTDTQFYQLFLVSRAHSFVKNNLHGSQNTCSVGRSQPADVLIISTWQQTGEIIIDLVKIIVIPM